MTDWGIALAALVVIVLVLGYRLLRRDPGVRRVRWGFFVERDRYQDDEPADPDETREWPRRDPPD